MASDTDRIAKERLLEVVFVALSTQSLYSYYDIKASYNRLKSLDKLVVFMGMSEVGGLNLYDLVSAVLLVERIGG